MDTQTIIDEFDKLTDEMSELSAQQKLDLAENKYRTLLNDREWEFLRQTATVTIASGEIAMPADFKSFAENIDTDYRYGFWIGDSFYPVVNMQNRRTHTAFSYYDKVNNKIVLADGLDLNGQSASFDYLYRPAELTLATEPVFDEDFHKIIPYLMAVEHDLIDKTEKGRSYVSEFAELAQNVKEDMIYQDDQYKEDWLTN